MQAVFADTCYWIAVTNTDDLIHQQALSLSRTLGSARFITSEDVLDEYLAYLSGARQSVREHAGTMVASLIANLKSSLFRKAMIPSCRADCISMETMRREGMSDVLTNERHFEQEGFRALFRS